MQSPDGAPATWLSHYRASDETEQASLERLSSLLAESPDPFDRRSKLHVTGSALVLDPPTHRVLLRWHAHQHDWLQVGGHADTGEADPYAIALREATEETGLFDLSPFPGPVICHVAVVQAAGRDEESGHEHIDVRYLLTTGSPEGVRPESPMAPLRWSPLEVAIELASDNLAETMRRALRVIRL